MFLIFFYYLYNWNNILNCFNHLCSVLKLFWKRVLFLSLETHRESPNTFHIAIKEFSIKCQQHQRLIKSIQLCMNSWYFFKCLERWTVFEHCMIIDIIWWSLKTHIDLGSSNIVRRTKIGWRTKIGRRTKIGWRKNTYKRTTFM